MESGLNVFELNIQFVLHSVYAWTVQHGDCELLNTEHCIQHTSPALLCRAAASKVSALQNGVSYEAAMHQAVHR